MKHIIFFIFFILTYSNLIFGLGFDYSETSDIPDKICKPVNYNSKAIFPFSILIDEKQVLLEVIKKNCNVSDCINTKDGHCYMDGVIEENGKNKDVAFFESQQTRDRAMKQLVKSGFCISL